MLDQILSVRSEKSLCLRVGDCSPECDIRSPVLPVRESKNQSPELSVFSRKSRALRYAVGEKERPDDYERHRQRQRTLFLRTPASFSYGPFGRSDRRDTGYVIRVHFLRISPGRSTAADLSIGGGGCAWDRNRPSRRSQNFPAWYSASLCGGDLHRRRLLPGGASDADFDSLRRAERFDLRNGGLLW